MEKYGCLPRQRQGRWIEPEMTGIPGHFHFLRMYQVNYSNTLFFIQYVWSGMSVLLGQLLCRINSCMARLPSGWGSVILIAWKIGWFCFVEFDPINGSLIPWCGLLIFYQMCQGQFVQYQEKEATDHFSTFLPLISISYTQGSIRWYFVKKQVFF